jgi:Bax protein
MQPDQRVAAFTNTLLPMITAANAAIQADRSRAVAVINAQRPSRADQNWLATIMDRYGAQSSSDLLTRLDTVPASLVLAQAAIESGWGADTVARTGNAFFGQRAWSTRDSIPGPQGERYRAYEHPQHSIASYMHNLNSHAAYAEFRQLRAVQRAQRRPLRGTVLAQGLHKYSTRGADYVAQVQRLINHRFKNLEPS